MRLIFALLTACVCGAQPDAATIIRRSVEANRRDWKAAPDYAYRERDRDTHGTKTYEVTMILGSPYERLVAINGKALASADRAKEQQKMNQTIARRRAESPAERAQRVAQYQKDRERDHAMMEELTRAFQFRLIGEGKMNGRDVYLLRATPFPGYKPPNMETQALTGMEGRLWIDKDSFQWVKVDAHVVHPVSIEGFLARVEPGTNFELEETPVTGGVWLPKHFAMHSRARVLFLFPHRSQEDETYSDYRDEATAEPSGARADSSNDLAPGAGSAEPSGPAGSS